MGSATRTVSDSPWRVDSDTLAHVDSLGADLILQSVEARAVVARLARERLDRREVHLEERLLKLAVVLVHEPLATLDLRVGEAAAPRKQAVRELAAVQERVPAVGGCGVAVAGWLARGAPGAAAPSSAE